MYSSIENTTHTASDTGRSKVVCDTFTIEKSMRGRKRKKKGGGEMTDGTGVKPMTVH